MDSRIDTMLDARKYKLCDIPSIGIGTYKLKTPAEINHTLECALRAGYKMIDTAILYKNEHLISQFLTEWFATDKNTGNCTREELWITTKMPYFTMLAGDETIIRACIEQSARHFGGYIDLYLIHASNPNDIQTWRLLREYQQKGLIRYIGLSNYNIDRLDNFINRLATEIDENERQWIYMNQIEYNPFLNRADLIQRCHELGIRVTAYGSLYKYNDTILAIARKYNTTPESILLKWTLTRGISVIPMSRNEEHIKENLASDKLILEQDEVVMLDGMNENYTRFAKHL